MQKIDARYRERMVALGQVASEKLSLAEAACHEESILREHRQMAMLEHAKNPGKYEYGSDYQKSLEKNKQTLEKDLSEFESKKSSLNEKISKKEPELAKEKEEIARLENKQQNKYRKEINKLEKKRDKAQQKLDNTKRKSEKKKYQRDIDEFNKAINDLEDSAARRYAERLSEAGYKADVQENELMALKNQHDYLETKINNTSETKDVIKAAEEEYELFKEVHEIIAQIELPNQPKAHAKTVIGFLTDMQQTLQQAHKPRNELVGALCGFANSLDPLITYYCPFRSLTDSSKVINLSTYIHFMQTAFHFVDSMELMHKSWQIIGASAVAISKKMAEEKPGDSISRLQLLLDMGFEAQAAAGWVPLFQTCTQATTLLELGLIIIRGGAPSPVISFLQTMNENMTRQFTAIQSKLEDLYGDLQQNTELVRKSLVMLDKVQETLNESRQLITKQLNEIKGEIQQSTAVLKERIDIATDAILTSCIIDQQIKFDSDQRLNFYKRLFINGKEPSVSAVELESFLFFTIEATRNFYTDLKDGGLQDRGVLEKTILKEPYLYTGLMSRLVRIAEIPNLYLLTSTSHVFITLMKKLLASNSPEIYAAISSEREAVKKALSGLMAAHRKFKELDSPEHFEIFYLHVLESSRKLKEAAQIQLDFIKERSQESREVRETWEKYIVYDETQRKHAKSHISFTAYMLREAPLPDFITKEKAHELDDFTASDRIESVGIGVLAGGITAFLYPPLLAIGTGILGAGVYKGGIYYLEKDKKKQEVLGKSLQAISQAFPQREGSPTFMPGRAFKHLRYFVHYYISNTTHKWDSKIDFRLYSKSSSIGWEEDWMDFTSDSKHVFSFTAKLGTRDTPQLKIGNLPHITPLNNLDQAFTAKFTGLEQNYKNFINCQLNGEHLPEDNLFQELQGNCRLIPGVAEHAIPLAFPKGLIEVLENELLAQYFMLNRNLSVQYELKPCGCFYRIQLLFSFKDSIDKSRDYFREVPLGHIDNLTVHAFNRIKFDSPRDKYEHLPFDQNEVLLLLLYQKFSQIGLPGPNSTILTPQIVIPSLVEVSTDFYHLWSDNYAYFSYDSTTSSFSAMKKIPFNFGKDVARVYEAAEQSKKDLLTSKTFMEYTNRLDLLNAYCALISEDEVRTEMIDLPGLIDPNDPYLNRQAIGLAPTNPELFYQMLKKRPSRALRRVERQLRDLEILEQSLDHLEGDQQKAFGKRESLDVGKISENKDFSLRERRRKRTPIRQRKLS